MRSIVETQEAERNSLAIVLRDNINQTLSSCKLMLESVAAHESASVEVKKSYDFIQKAIEQLKVLTIDLHPSPVLDLGFQEGMQEYISSFVKLYELPVYFNCTNEADDGMVENIQIPTFRILQDSLLMLNHYSVSTNIEINVEKTAEQYIITIKYNDAIFNFDISCKEWQNIRVRLEYLDGKIISLAQEEGMSGIRFEYSAIT
ncbi:MAG: hypothetical protein ABI415_07160 [Flavitalea sp.]